MSISMSLGKAGLKYELVLIAGFQIRNRTEIKIDPNSTFQTQNVVVILSIVMRKLREQEMNTKFLFKKSLKDIANEVTV